MVQLTEHDLIVNDAEVFRLKERFSQQHGVVLPGLLATSLLERIVSAVERAQLYRNQHLDSQKAQFGLDLTVRENELALHLIHFVINSRKLFNVIEKITRCHAIGSFGGRIYRNLPDEHHELDWHDDTDRPERMFGFSINLSRHAYQGGAFQLREKRSKRIVFEVDSSKAGDAHLFRVSKDLEHRVKRVEYGNARTSAAGWFLSAPDVATTLKALAKHGRILTNSSD